MNATPPGIGGCAFVSLAEPDCCGMPRDGGHAFTCALALTEECDGCGSAPGAPCFPFCYALLDDIDDGPCEPDPIRLLAMIDDDPDPLVRWHRVVDLLRPLADAGMFAAFTLNDAPSMVPQLRGAGWVDERGMVLIPHHPHRPLTPGMVLSQRDHDGEFGCPARRLVPIPIVVYPPAGEPVVSPDAVCGCGHVAAHHDGSGPAQTGCARWSGSLRWCGCLAFRSAPSRADQPMRTFTVSTCTG